MVIRLAFRHWDAGEPVIASLFYEAISMVDLVRELRHVLIAGIASLRSQRLRPDPATSKIIQTNNSHLITQPYGRVPIANTR